jgi:hypothetical protein
MNMGLNMRYLLFSRTLLKKLERKFLLAAIVAYQLPTAATVVLAKHQTVSVNGCVHMHL